MNVFYVICFDVHDAKSLRKISNKWKTLVTADNVACLNAILKNAQLQELQQSLTVFMEPTEDQVRYYNLCGKDKQHIVIDGVGRISADPDYTILRHRLAPNAQATWTVVYWLQKHLW